MGVQDAVLVGLALLAMPRFRVAWAAWRNSAGIAFLVALAYAILTLPLSSRPTDSIRDAIKVLDVCLFGFFIPALFPTPARLETAFSYTAAALSLLCGWDTVRLTWNLGRNIFSHAHGFEPFLLIHSNVSSLLSAAALIMCGYFAVTRRKEWGKLVLGSVGVLLHTFYIIIMASRGPQIALAVALLLGLLIFVPGWKKKLGLALVLGIGLAIGLLRINPRLADSAAWKTFAGRTTVWAHTLRLCCERPLLGYGYGLRVFRSVYHGSHPPPSPFDYWHPHQYWLYVLFAQGGLGLVLHFGAWLLLGQRLWRAVCTQNHPAVLLVVMLLVLLHVYGLADWLSVHLHILMLWLIPAALVVTRSTEEQLPPTCPGSRS
ncbi:MAG: O-antigen ligase family protein [Kiritimatiellia bacterium]